MGITYLASLPLLTLQEIYQDGPDVAFAAGIFPPQPAPQVGQHPVQLQLQAPQYNAGK
jgi:hypothetical protein